jgi:hypothetical protein
MQATGRMTGHAGPTLFQAIAALLVATALVVGLTLAVQRLSVGGASAPAADQGGTWTSGDISRSLSDSQAGVGSLPFDEVAFRRSEKEPLTTTPKNVVQIIPGEYRPIVKAEDPDAYRRGTIGHR